MRIRRIAALCLAFALAGCAGNTAGDGSAPSAGPAPSASAAPSAPGEDLPSVPPTGKPSEGDPVPPTGKPSEGDPVPPGDKPGTEQTITGEVVAGVEPGCLMLRGPDAVYQLLLPGSDVTAPKVGTKVTVTGTARLNMMTTCMQGTPFEVQEIRPA